MPRVSPVNSQKPKEAEVFAELVKLVPLAQNASDKMSVLRLLVAYMKCRWILAEGNYIALL